MRRLARSEDSLISFATLAGIYSERALITAGADLKLFYLILLLCLPILMLHWNFSIPAGYLHWLGALWGLGAASLFLSGNFMRDLLQEGIGITICSAFYLLFFSGRPDSLRAVFERYASVAFWVSLLGFPIALAETFAYGKIEPVRSILLEPAHFCQVVMPAFFYYAASSSKDSKKRIRALVLFAAILCSGSSTGVLALTLALALWLKERRRGLILIPAVLVPLLGIAYLTSDHLRMRVDDSFAGLTGENLAGVNLSTYTLLSNLYVTQRALADYPLFGTGLGSYEHTHARYIASLPGVESFLGSYAYTANAKDANSLGLRIATEFGFAGIVGVAFLLIRFRPAKEQPYSSIGKGALLYLFMKLVREGHYFSPEMYFFVWCYVLSSARMRGQRTRAVEPPVIEASLHLAEGVA
jgi:hypothetical protein